MKEIDHTKIGMPAIAVDQATKANHPHATEPRVTRGVDGSEVNAAPCPTCHAPKGKDCVLEAHAAVQKHVRLARERLVRQYKDEGVDVDKLEREGRLAEVPLKLEVQGLLQLAAFLRSFVAVDGPITRAQVEAFYPVLQNTVSILRWATRRALLAAGGNPYACVQCQRPTPDGAGLCPTCNTSGIDKAEEAFDRVLSDEGFKGRAR